MPSVVQIVTPPAAYPVTLAQLKDQVSVAQDNPMHDDLLTRILKAATEHVEQYLGRALVARTYDQFVNEFPIDGKPIYLQMPNLISLVRFRYRDADGEWVELADTDYQIDKSYLPSRVWPPVTASYWPISQYGRYNALEIRYVAGYEGTGSPADLTDGIPEDIKAAILLFAEHLFEQRGAVNVGNITTEIPLGMRHMLNAHRVWPMY